MPTNAVGIGPLSSIARDMTRGPRGIAGYMADGGEAKTESFWSKYNPLTGSYRRKKPLSVRAAETAIDFSPVGTVKAVEEIYDESQQEDPNLAKMGLMTLAEAAGMVPFAGPAVRTMARRVPADLAAEIAGLNRRSVDTEINNYRLNLEKNTDLSPEEIEYRVRKLSKQGPNPEDMFTEDVYHYSRGEFEGDTFDSSRSTSRFDRLGTHVGTKEAAKDRSKAYLGDMDAEKIFDLAEGSKGGSTMPLRARVDKPFLKETGEVFSEEEVRIMMNNYADQNKIADLDVATEAFKKDLTDSGFTHVPYKNNIEGRDPDTNERQVSYIMLTDRTQGDPAVLKGRFSKFEDVYDQKLMKADGGEIMNGIGSLNETARAMTRGPRGIGAYQQFAMGGEALGPPPMRGPDPYGIPQYADGGPIYMNQGGEAEVSEYRKALIMSESSGRSDVVNEKGYKGLTQAGDDALIDFKKEKGLDFTDEQYLDDPGLQMQFQDWYEQTTINFVMDKGLDQYIGRVIKGVPITMSSLLGMAHLGGNNGMKDFLESGGRDDRNDGNTSLSDYGAKFANMAIYGAGGGGNFNRATPEDIAMSMPVEQEGSLQYFRPQDRPEGLGFSAPLTSLRPQARPAPEPTMRPQSRPLALPEGRSMTEKYGLPGDMPEGGIISAIR